MMALPHAQYVLADAGTQVTAAANSSQVKTVSVTLTPAIAGVFSSDTMLLVHLFL